MRRLVWLLPFLFLSCVTKEIVEIPVETVRVERIYNVKTDSTLIKDSVDTRVISDTVYSYKEHLVYKYINTVDTVLKIDTVPKIVESIKEKEVNILRWWQKMFIYIGILAILTCIIYLVYKIKK